jgi:hypothetical protein
MKTKITIFLVIILAVQFSTHLLIRSSYSEESSIYSETQTSASSGGGASSNVSISDTDNQARILRGKEIFEKMEKQDPLPGHNPQVSGQLTQVPVLSLYITEKIWNGLNKEQQMDYTYYAESLIPYVRANPKEYVLISKSAPLYDTFVEKTRNLCGDCWSIDLLVPGKDGQLEVEKSVVQGDTPWGADDPCCRGVKASEFRK